MPPKRSKIPKIDDPYDIPFIGRKIVNLCRKRGFLYVAKRGVKNFDELEKNRSRIVTKDDLDFLFQAACTDPPGQYEFLPGDGEQALGREIKDSGDPLEMEPMDLPSQLIYRFDLTLELMKFLRMAQKSDRYKFYCYFEFADYWEGENSTRHLEANYEEQKITNAKYDLLTRFFHMVDTSDMDDPDMVQAYNNWLLKYHFWQVNCYFRDKDFEPKERLSKGWKVVYGKEPPKGFFDPDMTKASHKIFSKLNS